MKTKKQTKETLTSNLSSVELENHVQVNNIHNDIVALINKYAGDKLNTSAYSDNLDNKEGFFLMWVKKDTNLPAYLLMSATISL